MCLRYAIDYRFTCKLAYRERFRVTERMQRLYRKCTAWEGEIEAQKRHKKFDNSSYINAQVNLRAR